MQLQRAMAAEAEAAREARAKVIAAEGEQKASHALKEAAQVIQESPSALQVCIFISILYQLIQRSYFQFSLREAYSAFNLCSAVYIQLLFRRNSGCILKHSALICKIPTGEVHKH